MQTKSSSLAQPNTSPRALTGKLIASAIASQKIEGLELDAQARADFTAFETGQVSLSDLRTRLVTRYRKAVSTL